jgi:Glyoxalase superfamily protein/Clp amino terminal domain, pathogenicity island component
MRDFRDAKAMAQTVRAALAAKGLKITISESLELIAKGFGAPDWNTLSAAIKAAGAEPDRSQRPASPPPADARPAREPPDAIPPAAGRVRFRATLEETLHRAVGLAVARKHELTTLEHLLLALINDADAAEVMRACNVDLGALGKTLTAFIDNELKSLAVSDGEDPAPTGGFQRVVQRAVIHVQTSGRDEVTGANVLVAIFSERESAAAAFLRQQGMNRYDAVSFIAHGSRNAGGRAA